MDVREICFDGDTVLTGFIVLNIGGGAGQRMMQNGLFFHHLKLQVMMFQVVPEVAEIWGDCPAMPNFCGQLDIQRKKTGNSKTALNV